MKKNKKQKNIKERIAVEKVAWQWKAIEYLSYVAVFSIPLYVNKVLSYPFNTSKITILILIVALQAILFFFAILKTNQFKLKITYPIIILSVFLLILTMSSLFGIDPINSFWGWKDYVSLVPIYFLGLFSIFIGTLVRQDKRYISRILFVSLVTAVLVMLFYYFSNANNPLYRQGSTLGNNSYLGTYLMFNIAFGIGLFFYFKKVWQKILIAVFTLFIALSPLFINTNLFLGKINLKEVIVNPIVLSGIAHGAILGLFLTILFSICLSLIILSGKKVFKIIGALLLVAFLSGLLYIGLELRNDQSKIYQVYVAEKSDNRFLARDIAKTSFKADPIMGNGFNNYIYNFQTHFNPKIYSAENAVEKFTYPHNVFWQYASDGGILGLVIYLALLGIIIISFLRRSNGEEKRVSVVKIILGSLVLGYFVSNLFIFDTIVIYLMFFLLIGLAIGFWPKDIKIFEWKLTLWGRILSYIGVVLGVLAIIFLFYLPTREASFFNRTAGKTKNVVAVTKEAEKIQKISLFGGVEDSTYYAKYLLDSYQENYSAVNEENRAQFLDGILSAVKIIQSDIEKQPNLNEAYLTMSRLLNLHMYTNVLNKEAKDDQSNVLNEELWDKSRQYLEKSIELSPNNIQPYLLMSDWYLLKNDFTKAEGYIKEALAIAPENKVIYEAGKNLLEVKPDLEFEKYLSDMKTKHFK